MKNCLLYFVLISGILVSLKGQADRLSSCDSPITIAPYLGIDETKLVVLSLYNQDVLLLQQRKNLVQHNPQISKRCPPAIFEISGMMAFSWNVNEGRSIVFVDSAELDFANHIQDWATLFFDVAYNNDPIYRVGHLGHSKIRLDRVFVTIGNFNQSPIYLTLGRRYVPFGQYYSYMISGAIGQTLAKVEADSLLVGYAHPDYSGPYAALYAIKSVKKLFWDTSQTVRGGYTLGYQFLHSSFNYDVGIDYTESISMAQVFQAVGVKESIPGIDLHLKTGLNAFTLTAEFTTAISQFNESNAKGKPAALYYELGYQMTVWNKLHSVALGYGKTYEASTLNVPKKVFNLGYNMSLSQFAVLSAQYQYNANYRGNTIGKNIFYIKLISYF